MFSHVSVIPLPPHTPPPQLKSQYPAILYSALQEERDRQITAMKERVARVKYERTQTMKERGATTSRQFDELVSDAGAGMTFYELTL